MRAVGKLAKSWILDPSPFDSMLFCQLCVFIKKSSLDLDWNLSNYRWKHPHSSSQTKFIHLFQYFVKLGRKLLLSKKLNSPSAMKVCLANGPSLMDAFEY